MLDEPTQSYPYARGKGTKALQCYGLSLYLLPIPMLEGKGTKALQCYGLSLYLPSVVGAVAVLVE